MFFYNYLQLKYLRLKQQQKSFWKNYLFQRFGDIFWYHNVAWKIII